MKELKMKSLKGSIVGIVIAAGIIIAMIVATGSSISALIKGPEDLWEVDYATEDLDGLYVKGILDYNYGAYCEETEGTDRVAMEYLINAGDEYFMGMRIRVTQREYKQIEALDQVCLDYSNGYATQEDVIAAQFEIFGTIHAMPSENLSYYHDAVDYDSLTQEEQALFLPYYLEVGKIGNSVASGLWVFAAIVAACLFCIVFILVKVFSGSYQKSITKYIAASHNPELTRQQVETFLSSNEYVNGLKYNSQFITAQNGATTIFGETSKMVWAYAYTVTHKRNFITTGHSYFLVLGFADGAKYQIVMGNEAQVQEHLKKLSETFPYMIIGYKDELDRMFKQKDRKPFLDLLYNPYMEQQAKDDPFANI